ncbi:MAG: YqaE/Pmp3 family membrane protein [Crocinitomicaceae bacterium]|nr:YqaE/Pmp3 family membrane protein [Crocinitomicaceae bacterium]
MCFILPPLAVFLFEGASSRFWIDLILFIIGIAVVGWLLNGLSGLALLVSVIFALLIVLGVI